MSVDSSFPSSNPAIGILLVDDDPVFRLGLRMSLERFSDLCVVAAVGDAAAALEAIAQSSVVPAADATPSPTSNSLDLVVLALELGQADPTQMQGLELCQRINEQYPGLPVVLLGTAVEPIVLGAMQQAGARGYCLKTVDIETLVSVVRRVAIGQSVWQVETDRRSSDRSASPLVPQTSDESAVRPVSPQQSPAVRSQLAQSVQRWRQTTRLSGVRQIEAALNDVITQLQNPDLSLLERAILAGQYRELRAARWLVNHLLATRRLDAAAPVSPTAGFPKSGLPNRPQEGNSLSVQIDGDRPPSEPAPLVVSDSPAQAIARLQSIVFDAVLAKLQMPLQNLTQIPLEIDILRDERKRELLYQVLRHIERLLDELRYSQVTAAQISEKQSQLLMDLWESVTTDFFGKYYTVALDSQSVEVVDALLRDRALVRAEILDKIPFTTDLITHLLFQAPLMIDGVSCSVGTPAAIERAQIILENWIIQIANAVMQPLLNAFAHVELIKQNLYDRRLMSSREIERFRNDLSWRYRFDTYFGEPQAIFESRYRLFAIRGRGIRQLSVYAPRTQELEQLSGVPFVVTLALETRDALSPRVRSLISFLGSSVVYVLTEVIGRGIGLIGRGILKGIGSSWQDGRFNRDPEFNRKPDFTRDSEG